ncbi:MAG: hypothetical protein AB8B53_04250 [Flavobacteriales bacterium]
MTYRLLCITTIAFSVLFSFLIWGGYGLIGSCLIAFFTVPVWSSVYMNTKRLTLNELNADFQSFISEGFWRIVILVPVNLLSVFTLGRLTMLPDVPLLYFLAGFVGYSYAYFRKNKKNLYWFGIGVFPSVLSVLLFLNYYISFSPSEETYLFKSHSALQVSKIENETFIIGYRIQLEDGAY